MPRLARWTFPLVVCGVLAAVGSWLWCTAASHAAPTNPAPADKKPVDKKPADKTPVVPNSAQPAKGFKLLPGFQAELLYTVPKNRQGSWVNLAVDPQGRLITSDQNGKLFRITPPPIGDHHTATFVEALDVNIGDAQGLLCAFGNLYVVVNGRAA
ncbi:MAG: hypothetical protein K8T25_23485, partial [Planctomycetia bacterium]|nr:hypothetical protein [Planctomycetia bacterium]